jgi:predicted alpha/beta-fold hydrolase
VAPIASVGPREERDPDPGTPFSHHPEAFQPAWWLPGPHAQTLGGRLLREGTRPRYRRERWETPDGDFLDLDFWAAGAQGDPARGGGDGTTVAGDDRRPVVLILHGLEGCSESGYVVESCRRLAARGCLPVALNFRSRSGEPNRTRRFYHSGETGDLAFVLDRLADRPGERPVGVLGYSLGGNVLLKYLGERGAGARPRVQAAAAVSVPYRLSASARRMERGMGRLYSRFFLRSLRRSLQRKVARRGHSYDLERLERVGTLRAFDDAFTAPVHGFRDAEDYYRRSSSARYLHGIRVPTLLLQARDDPFLPREALPEAEMEANPWLLPRITEAGGHLGFVEAEGPWGARFWAESEAARYLARALDAEDARPGPRAADGG